MNKERLQYEMFSGELVDDRTRTQKRRDRQRNLPQQLSLFDSQTAMELARSRYTYPYLMTRDGRPLLLSLMIQDPRSEEEIEEARMHAAEEQTYPLIPETQPIAQVEASPPSATTPLSR